MLSGCKEDRRCGKAEGAIRLGDRPSSPIGVGCAKFRVDALERLDATVVADDALRRDQLSKLVPFGKKVGDLLRIGRHLNAAAAVDDGRGFPGQTLSGTGGVHGGVPGADDDHMLTELGRVIAGHAIEEPDRPVNAFSIDPLDAEAGITGEAAGDIDGIEPGIQELGWGDLDRVIALDRHAERFDPCDVVVYDR